MWLGNGIAEGDKWFLSSDNAGQQKNEVTDKRINTFYVKQIKHSRWVKEREKTMCVEPGRCARRIWWFEQLISKHFENIPCVYA